MWSTTVMTLLGLERAWQLCYLSIHIDIRSTPVESSGRGEKHMAALFFEQALIPQGWAERVRIELHDGRISRIAVGSRAQDGDECHAVAIPGLCNLHSHAFQRGMAGLTERRGATLDSFWTWRDLMYRFVGRMTPDDIEAVAAQAYVDMLEAGFIRVGEFHYIHHDPTGTPYANIAELAERVVASAETTGIAITLLPVFYAHAGFGGREPDAGQRRFVNNTDRFARLMEASRRVVKRSAGAMVGVAPHSLRAVTPEELDVVVGTSAGGPIHIHIAEQLKEVEECVAWSGQRPIEWLFDHAPVDNRWCLVHATHATSDEMSRIAASRAVAGLCPITEANLGDGTFDGVEFLDWRGVFGVGTDSNVLIGAADELRQLEYSQRLERRARNVLSGRPALSTGRTLFEGALAGGAQALGVAVPGLVAGAPADIVSLDAEHVALAGRRGDAILDSWIFAARESPIDCVWARGEKRVSSGRHHKREAVALRFRQTLERLLKA
jgi:formiminoglutamate deiminase